MKRLTAWGILFASTAGILFCAYWLVIDWSELDKAYQAFNKAAQRGADLRTLFIHQSHQDAHRTNVFAESLWILLGGVSWILGFVSLCVLDHQMAMRARFTIVGEDGRAPLMEGLGRRV